MTKAEWSGWMQAVFSVLAILAAVAVAFAQHRQNLLQRSIADGAERARALGGHIAIAERCFWTVESYLQALRRPLGTDGVWGSPIGIETRLQELVSAFESLRLESLPGYDVVHASLEIRDELRRAVELLQRIAATKNSGTLPSHDDCLAVERCISSARKEIEILLNELERALAAAAD